MVGTDRVQETVPRTARAASGCESDDPRVLCGLHQRMDQLVGLHDHLLHVSGGRAVARTERSSQVAQEAVDRRSTKRKENPVMVGDPLAALFWALALVCYLWHDMSKYSTNVLRSKIASCAPWMTLALAFFAVWAWVDLWYFLATGLAAVAWTVYQLFRTLR